MFVREPRWFLIGRTFPREPSWKYSSNCDEAIFGVQKASLNTFWEYSLSSANVASDWLRAESSPVDEEERKQKMDDGVDASLLSCGRRRLVSGIQNDIVIELPCEG